MRSPWVFLGAFALVCYGAGAAFVEGFVNLPGWRLICSDLFGDYHGFVQGRTATFVLGPMALGTLLTVAMLAVRPRAIPRWSVVAAIVLQAVTWVGTLALAAPLRAELGEGFSPGTLDRLLTVNLWLSRVPQALGVVLFFWMLSRVIDAREAGDVHSPV